MPIRDDQFTPLPTLDQVARIGKLQHQVQSAVAFLMGKLGNSYKETQPKFLRVGVNSAMIETSALARLMLSKGIITNTEYFEMIIAVWTEERDNYQAQLTQIDPRLTL